MISPVSSARRCSATFHSHLGVVGPTTIHRQQQPAPPRVAVHVVDANGDGSPLRPTRVVVVEYLSAAPSPRAAGGFLKLPTSSFFLVSTLITGNPLARYNLRIRA